MFIEYRKLKTWCYSIEISWEARSRVIGFVDHARGLWYWVEPKTRDGQKKVRRRRGEYKTLTDLKLAVNHWVFSVCEMASESWTRGI